MRSYVIIGTGAVGGLYGAQLYKNGHPVRFLVRSDWSAVREQALRWTLPNIVIVATKTTTPSNQLREILSTVVESTTTTVLVLQNGYGVEDTIATLTPNAVTILGGLCFLCSNRVASGHIKHIDHGLVVVGAHTQDSRNEQALTNVIHDFQGAGIPTERTEDLVFTRWKKLVWNIPFNGLSVVANADTDVLVRESKWRCRVEAIMKEVVEFSEADGHPVPADVVQNMIVMTENTKPYASSMKLDAAAGRSLELGALYEAPIAVADRYGVAVPQMRRLYEELKAIDARAEK